jgi:hypothetical protein
MATLRPELTEAQLRELPSQAEARFYRACRNQLPDRILVLHSISWVSPNAAGTPCDGEADFVIFDPAHGMLVIEVKGGGVSYDPARSPDWVSIDGRGREHRIKDPFRQASTEKHSLLAQFKASPHWDRLGRPWILCGHAVFLPDVHDVASLACQQRPREIIGGQSDLRDLTAWVARANRYWSARNSRIVPLGAEGVAAAQEVFSASLCVRPLVSVQLQDEEERRIKLTSQQARILRTLASRKRAAICGGAGTGKTILALQKARELAAAGGDTLLLCYNRPLSDHMKDIVAGTPKLLAMTFHQLCDWMVERVRVKNQRDLLAEAREFYPGEDHFEVHLPFALGLAADEIEDRFDAMVVDEAQDFADDYWLPLEIMLRDPSESQLYVFFDPNQSVYRRPQKLPVREEPFPLLVNCRNTKQIHELTYRYFDGQPTEACEIDGAPIELICESAVPVQARRIAEAVSNLLANHRVAAADLCVLLAGPSPRALSDLLQRHSLPSGVRWSNGQHGLANAVLVETVNRFKGLEAAVIFLWGVTSLDPVRDRESFYVGTSRAKSRLILVGDDAACRKVMSPL